MKSMTSYGRAMREDGTGLVEVEIRSVNGRFFKFSPKLPPEIAPYENEIKKMIAASITRGNVYLTIHYQSGDSSTTRINKQLLKSYYLDCVEIASSMGISAPSMDALINLPGMLDGQTSAVIDDQKWLSIRKVIEQALQRATHMRCEEGKHLKEELVNYNNELKNFVAQLQEKTPQIVVKYRKRIHTRLQELINEEKFSYTDEDILREVAIFSDRIDVSEELTRMQSHLEQIFATISSKRQAVGKSLDFLLQEVVRESNTISSKASDAGCSQLVVEIKNTIEKMREQVQNVE